MQASLLDLYFRRRRGAVVSSSHSKSTDARQA